MREIEFRAWDKELKEMLTMTSLECKRYLVLNHVLRDSMIAVLMQYTGLKDKTSLKFTNLSEVYQEILDKNIKTNTDDLLNKLANIEYLFE